MAKAEHVAAKEINDLYDEAFKEEEASRPKGLSNETARSIFLADLAWQAGKYANTDEAKRIKDHDKRIQYGLDIALTDYDTELSPAEFSYISFVADDAYNNPDFVIAQGDDGTMAWQNKKFVGKHPYARSIKQVLNGYAQAFGTTPQKIAEDIAPEYDAFGSYLNAGNDNVVGWAVDEALGGRINELMADPQLMYKDGARLKAALGDAGEGVVAFAPVGFGLPAKGTKMAYTGAETLPKVAQAAIRAGKGALKGAAAGIGSSLFSQGYDAVAPQGNREDRGFNPKETAMAGLLGGVAGGVGGAAAPVNKSAAGRSVLYSQAKDKPAFMNTAKKEIDELYKAADKGAAARGEGSYVYEPMNKPEFDVDFQAPEMPKRSRGYDPEFDPEVEGLKAGDELVLADNAAKPLDMAKKSGIDKEAKNLVRTDMPLVQQYGGEMRTRFPKVANEFKDWRNTNKFLKNSQTAGTNEFDMTHGPDLIPRRTLNERRGFLSQQSNDPTYNNLMYKLYGEYSPVGASKDAWDKAKKAVSARESLAEGANAKDNIVGGPDFHKKVKEFRGSPKGRRTAQVLVHSAGMYPNKAQEDDYYGMDFIPTKH